MAANKSNLLDLLKANDAFIVPTIQRDYAQGRDNGSNKALCEEVRTGLINSLHDALINNKGILLDFIYGTKNANIFYPIDGQQRLTTLFLLHWYIGKKEKIEVAFPQQFELLKRFSYEIRDTSKEFCKSLIDVEINFCSPTKIQDQIKDSAKFHYSYNFDPTVSSMLTVLDTIHDSFKEDKIALWERLNKVEFWCLSLEDFGLTDDLFVKMNARGKRLSRFDVFKSDLESKIEKIGCRDSETWKAEIDNTYLDAYWNKFRFELAERNLFRTILFYGKSLISAENASSKYDDSWEIDDQNVNYNDVIAQMENDAVILTNICHLLSNFDAWKDSVDATGLFINPTVSEQINITGYNKVKIFGILHWFSFDYKMIADSNFIEYERILENYIFSLRQPNISPTKRFYSSSIDNSNVGKSFSLLKKIISEYNNQKDSFNDYILSSSFSELEYEKEKLRYSPLKDIIDLEKIPFLGKNITNFFFGGKVYLNAQETMEIAADDSLVNKSLRTIFSYASDKYGRLQDLLLDRILYNSGRKKLYYKDAKDQIYAYMHKFSFIKADNDTITFGDRNLTSRGNDIYSDISGCVQSFIKDLSTKIHVDKLPISVAIDSLLNERILSSDFSDPQNVKWYIVKYREFFYSDTSTTLSVLRRQNLEDDNIYDMQCLDDNNNPYELHYHPFYLALSNRLNNQITISSILKYTGVQIEYEHPCVLSNGWKIQISKEGNWVVDFNGKTPTTQIQGIHVNTDGKGEVDCKGKDCIELFAGILNNLSFQAL